MEQKVKDVYNVRNVVYNDNYSSIPEGKVVAYFLPSNVPYLKFNHRLVDY